MKLEDLPEMFQQNGEMRIKSLEARLAYAKELLGYASAFTEGTNRDNEIIDLIEKLNSEGL